MKDIPNPGSLEAEKLGCKCPIIDNGHGRGYMGVAGLFVFSLNCPVHKAPTIPLKKSNEIPATAAP